MKILLASEFLAKNSMYCDKKILRFKSEGLVFNTDKYFKKSNSSYLKWNNLIAERDVELTKEAQRQEENDKLRKEFAKHANAFHQWLTETR